MFYRLLLIAALYASTNPTLAEQSLAEQSLAEQSLADKRADCIVDGRAIEWLQAIEKQDWSQMHDLLAESAVYLDPTMHYFGGDDIRLVGKESITEFWKKSSVDSGAANIQYKIIRCYQTGRVNVLELELDILVSGDFWNVNKAQLALSGKQTTILTIIDDQITGAVDYVDYADVTNQLNQYRDKYGEKIDSTN